MLEPNDMILDYFHLNKMLNLSRGLLVQDKTNYTKEGQIIKAGKGLKE